MKIEQWFEQYSISEKLQEKIKQIKIIEVLPADEERIPFVMKSSDEIEYKVFLIQDNTPEALIKTQYLGWIEHHFNEIFNGKLPFLIIQDTKAIRFKTTLYEWGLKDHVISRASERLYKREDLMKKLQKIADKIPTTEFPLTVDEIHVFGSILRDKEMIADVDMFLKCSMSEDQQKRMENLKEDLRNASDQIIDLLGKEHRKTKRAIKKIIEESEALQTILRKLWYPIEWAKCLTWARVRDPTEPPPNNLIPEEREIIRKLLIGNIKGFKDCFIIYKPWVAAHHVLAWSLEKQNVRENIDGRSESEKMELLKGELDTLIDEVIRFHDTHAVVQEGGQSGKTERQMPETLSIETPKVKRIGNETKEELKEKIEIIRKQLRELVYKWTSGWEMRDD